MRFDRPALIRATALLLSTTAALGLSAQDAPVVKDPGTPLFHVDNSLLYALIVLAVVQVIFIVSLASIMRTLGGAGAWARGIGPKGGRALLLPPLLFLAAHDAHAQAYVGHADTMSTYRLFWWLLGTNLLLFIILLVQIGLIRGITKAVTGQEEQPLPAPAPAGPTWMERLSRRLTRQVAMDKEQDIVLHHEYDGIRELDNVLPPWWVWMFYGTIIWSIIYLVSVHVIKVVPDQRTEYAMSMEQARNDVAAYKATQHTVDENNVEQSTDPAVLAAGGLIFKQNCTPCHGADAAGSETSVGPNLTDAYWLHGGGVKNVFHTITYGVPEKGMISWKSQLKPTEIAALTSYVLNLQGTGGPTQKAPQGDLWQEGTAAADSTAGPGKLGADTIPAK
ncbi:MAG: cbb3-type cytochrome c oxidase N-terminal domain-containing protein [Flavobacteriales bacterium]